VLLNPVYRGKIVYARTTERRVRVGEELKRRKRHLPSTEWGVATTAHDPLVDQMTWDSVAARFAGRAGLPYRDAAAEGRRGRAPSSLLSGLIRCGECDGNFVAWTSQGPTCRKYRGGVEAAIG
jgi:hypothetical protein